MTKTHGNDKQHVATTPSPSVRPPRGGGPPGWENLYERSYRETFKADQRATLRRIVAWARGRPPLSHARLVARDADEVARLRSEVWVRRKQADAALPVIHDRDGACCRIEGWEETVKSVLGQGGKP
jgi:hypothetical protein